MKTIKLFSLLLALATLTFTISSCSDDEPIIKKTEGLAVADGFYMTISGSDPVSTGQLTSEQAEDGDAQTIDREGFVGNYLYLAAGDYNLVQVVSKEITSTLGGATSTVDGHDSECELKSITVVAAEEVGAAFTIGTAGIYKVTYDKTFSEIVIFKIENAVVIGSATPAGWGHSADMIMSEVGTSSAEGFSYSIEGLILRPGEFKMRFNCGWKINRSDAVTDRVDGYNSLTNFGGTFDNLEPGGANFEIGSGEDGEYTLILSWVPTSGFSATLTKTGDAPEITFDPDEHPWSIRGEQAVGSPSDWGSGPLLTPNHDDTSVYRWYGVIRLSEGTFKVSDGTSWIGFSGITDNSGLLTEAASDNNIEISAANAGFYYFTVTTADEGATAYNITIDKASFGVIGDASSGGWDADTDMTENGSSFTVTLDLTAASWKFRANDAWEYNLGTDLSALVHNGDNFSVTDAGNYTITLTTADRGVTYTGEATKN